MATSVHRYRRRVHRRRLVRDPQAATILALLLIAFLGFVMLALWNL